MGICQCLERTETHGTDESTLNPDSIQATDAPTKPVKGMDSATTNRPTYKCGSSYGAAWLDHLGERKIRLRSYKSLYEHILPIMGVLGPMS